MLTELVAAIACGELHVRRKAVAEAVRRLLPAGPPPGGLAVVCVGSTCSTGDALGPLAGTILSQIVRRRRWAGVPVQVFGTLGRPVHGTNLDSWLQKLPPDAFVLAVDAAAGTQTGQISVYRGPLQPGAGAGNQGLPPVGDAHILGITGVSNLMMFYADLGQVAEMAGDIATGIWWAVAAWGGKPQKQGRSKRR